MARLPLLFGIVCALLSVSFVLASASSVATLTSKDFTQTLEDNENILVKFYAPWCGHCKSLAPVYEEAAKKLEGVAKLAEIDCDQHPEVCGTHKIEGFPTLLWFHKSRASPFTGERTAESIATFVQSKLKELEKPADSVVEVLTSSSLSAAIAAGDVVIEFYAPWCGHCQRLEPEFEKLAKERDDIKFAKINCDLNGETCAEHGIRGYPKVKFYKQGRGHWFHGTRTAEDMNKWLDEKVDEEPTPAVEQLTGDIWNDTVVAESSGPFLVEFYAPWCGHCKALAGDYNEAAKRLSAEGVRVAKIDCTQDGELCSEQSVAGYPSIKFYNKGHVYDYNGERSAEGFVKFCNKKIQGAVTVLTTEKDAKEFAAKENAVVGYFADSDDVFSQYSDIANENEDVVFGAVTDAELVKKLGAKVNTVAYNRPESVGEDIVFEGAIAELKDWLLVNSLPLVGEIGPSNFRAYVESARPLVLAFFDVNNEEQKTKVLDTLTTLAKSYVGSLSFGWSDGVEWRQVAERFYGDFKNLPVVVTLQFAKDRQIGYPEEAEWSEENLRVWLDGIVTGTIEWKPRSEPVPETQDEAVYKVVGETLQQVIDTPDKDVLIEFYAPWCGHCQKLAPTYEKLAQGLKGVESLIIAKFDAQNNDVRAVESIAKMVQGYPTLLFWSAKDKSTPIMFDQSRDIEGFVTFLQDKSSVKFDLPKEFVEEWDENKDVLVDAGEIDTTIELTPEQVEGILPAGEAVEADAHPGHKEDL